MFNGKSWKGHAYDLGRMTFRELVVAYVTYPAIQVYGLLAVISLGLAVWWLDGLARPLIAAAITIGIYPAVWYALHRWILHGRWLYRMKWSAAMWKRIHFDHHQDPNKLEVLFGSLANTLPTLLLFVLPIGWAIGGPAGAAAALGAGLLTTCFYEFCHCIQHLNYKPRYALLAHMKERHLQHHFHNENGNYGITNFAVDHLLGTYYETAKDMPRSATVFNLGYDIAEAERYPWVADLSGELPRDRPRRPAQGLKQAA
jgi:sterol desaturase/sphingolipid hydroxylase (fatty acid hydroxylase superfamily)